MSTQRAIALLAKPLLYLVVVVAVMAFLAASASAESITVVASHDTWIISAEPGVNYGDFTYVKVGAEGSFGNERALFKFDLPSLPAEAWIESATFQAFYDQGTWNAPDMNIAAHRLTVDWQESTATWLGLGSASASTAYDSTVARGSLSQWDSWLAWDVTSLAREWFDGTYPNYGLALHGQEGPPDNGKSFDTKELGAGWEPRLIIQWSTPSQTPTPTATPASTPTPSVTPVSSSATTEVVQDTYIGSGTSANFDGLSLVEVGSDTSIGNLRGLFKFSLPSLPTNAFIESATFRAYYLRGYGASEDMLVSVHRLTQDWQENAANWPLMGGASDTYTYDALIVGYQSSSFHKSVSWDATELVRQWYVNGYPNYGLALHGKEGPPAASRWFLSRENGTGWGAKLAIGWSYARPVVVLTTLRQDNDVTLTWTQQDLVHLG